MRKPRKFTIEEDNFLKENYLIIPAKRMSKMIDRSESCARQRMKLLGIVVPDDVIQKFKEESQYKKGAVSYNKGKKQLEYMTADALERTKKTRFQKGQLPHNTKEQDGIITIRIDTKTGIQYQYIRLSVGKWRELHRHNYEKHFGKIPKTMVIAFKDRNSLNATPENLELITKKENMQRNTIHNYTPEIKTAIRSLSKLKKKIKNAQEQTIRS